MTRTRKRPGIDMPIPTQFDAQLSELETLHAQIVTGLRILRWSGRTPARRNQIEDLLSQSATLARALAAG